MAECCNAVKSGAGLIFHREKFVSHGNFFFFFAFHHVGQIKKSVPTSDTFMEGDSSVKSISFGEE